jgi:sugar/nucleoside kinase (ribokinase family)
MMAQQNSDVAVVGHFSIDTIKLPSRAAPFVVMGGSVAYVSLTTKLLGGTASVISKVGGDFPEAYLQRLRQEGVDVSGVVKVADAQTTRFELEYNKDVSSRTLRLKNKAPVITIDDIPRALNAEAVHVAPIAGEIPYEVVEHLRGRSEVLALDPQGMLRSFDDAGKVTFRSKAEKRLLSLVDIYKSSSEEIQATTRLSDLNAAVKAVHDFGVKIVLVTMGANGAVLSAEGALHTIPVCICRKYVDPTGAGDVFIGAFLTEYNRKKDPVWCACVGSAAASSVVESVGSTVLGEKEDIYQRARIIYEKEIKP